MGPKLSFLAIILIWIISFVEPSGYAQSFHLPDKVNTAIVLLSVVLFCAYPRRRQHISPFVAIGLLISFILYPVLVKNSYEGLSYLTSFLCVYLISNGTYTKKVIMRSGMAVAFMGLVVLYIYANGEILSGWNDNAISMVGLFSFLYFSVSLIYLKGKRSFWLYNIISLIYIELLFATDCRSGMLFLIISILCVIFSKRARKILAKNNLRAFWLLNAPLLLAFIVIAVAASPYFSALDAWSMRTLEKGIFDGRDTLWEAGLLMLEKSMYWGWGKFVINYHNSGIAVLSVFGILGYISWIAYFYGILKKMIAKIDDKIVFGCYSAFILIFLQQALDLGLVSPEPNLIPYMILGVALSRIRQLKANKA